MFRKTFLSAAVGAAMIMAPVATGLASAETTETPTVAAVTVYYDDSGAPSYQSQIAQGVANWNSTVSNVRLEENPSAATLDFREGDDPNGSYAYTDGHGNGYVFLDHTQMGVFAPVRITAHETGHVLGLPDNYSGPCSELMSGGGPGPSCTNATPNADEIGRVDTLWANGKQAPGAMKRIEEPTPAAAY